MKCEGCDVNLDHATGLPLTLSHNQITVQCPVCRCVMAIIYNRRKQVWETMQERDERRARWRRGG